MAKLSPAAAAKRAAKNVKSPSLFLVDPIAEPIYVKGQLRSFLVTTPTVETIKKRLISDSREYILLAILLVLSIFVRLHDLAGPGSVVFDEVHFGGFARKYILGKFFMDVHPPLAKMLFAGVGLLGGFNGEFEFKTIGDVYPKDVPYLLMRQFPAILGIGTVFLAYFTLKNSGVRPLVAFITSILLIVENANVTISRFILLDSPLIFFIAASVFAWKKFEIQVPFTANWFRSLAATGLALGLAVSSKWVGLFTIAWVGVLCLYQLWFIIGDLQVSSKKIVSHFVARGAFLLGIPAVLYFLFFAIHFQLLQNEGDGAAFMTSAFRLGLVGSTIPKDITANVGLGSIVTIRHLETQGGYLHSHNHFYPTGSKQQQVTLYPHLDSNNDWLIEPYNETVYNQTFVPLTNGLKIRLKHVNSGRRLHSHDEKAPVSERDWQKEASCYGFDGFGGDANDDFTVEIVEYKSKGDTSSVRALDTVIRLRHAMTGNYLFSSEVKLPEWGFKQQEVSAAGQGLRKLTHWYIETNTNAYLDEKDREVINYPIVSTWSKFVELHKRMWSINLGLKEHHAWQSDPSSWPLLLRGINYWVRNNTQVYLMGNAVVWWGATVSLVVFGIHALISIVRWHLGQAIATDKNVHHFNVQVFTYALGWFLHYFPFFIMGRQLFLHHYLPSLYFGILALGHFLEIFTGYITAKSKILQKVGYAVVVGFTVLSALFYIHYSLFIYAKPWTRAQCESSKALSGWDFDCNNFHVQYSDYSPEASASRSAAAALSSSIAAETASPIENPATVNEAAETPFVPNEQQEEVVEQRIVQEVKEEVVRQQQAIVPEVKDQVVLEAEKPVAPKVAEPAAPKVKEPVVPEDFTVKEPVVEEHKEEPVVPQFEEPETKVEEKPIKEIPQSED